MTSHYRVNVYTKVNNKNIALKHKKVGKKRKEKLFILQGKN